LKINKCINSQSGWEGKEHCNGALFLFQINTRVTILSRSKPTPGSLER
jgi:hypothetical protein